jgi:hypothetical protein
MRIDDTVREGGAAGGVDNVPGFAYLQRVATAMYRTLISQAEEMNEAWPNIRRGHFDFGTAVRLWANMVEGTYGVITEVLQGPTALPRPAWLVIPYSKSTPRKNYSVALEGAAEPDSDLDRTPFVGLQAQPPADLYAGAPRRVGTRVEFELRDDVIQKLGNDTDYISLILRKAQGAATPLVVVVLRVQAGRRAEKAGSERAS